MILILLNLIILDGLVNGSFKHLGFHGQSLFRRSFYLLNFILFFFLLVEDLAEFELAICLTYQLH